MSIYKENILEIVDNWNGYPLQDPACATDFSDLGPAINAGVVELKCFINNTCPFYKSAYKEDGLVFDENTYRRILPWLPDDLSNALTVTESLNGMYFRPRWVYRHNYIYQKVDPVDTVDTGNWFGDFDTNYKEVGQIGNKTATAVVGADYTKYKSEQSWVITESIFDPDCEVTIPEECGVQAEWRYRGQKVSDSDMTDRDVSYDYKKEYYEAYRDSYEETGPQLKEGETLRINTNRAQMPVQTRVFNSQNRGVHWRLVKKTPLFKGEDFFIRFYKQADDTIGDPGKKKPIPFPDSFNRYWPLDITRNDKLNISPSFFGFDEAMRKRNFAVSSMTAEDEVHDVKKFDFRDQAYYIIELGEADLTDNYFIIITERANPIFVNFVPAYHTAFNQNDPEVVSKKLGDPAPISGKQLIDAEWFEMTVRNHLGSIVIQFSGPGINVPPWVIKRWDWVGDRDPTSNKPYLREKVRSLFVPRGRMVMMGGNIRCGFLFGPLQYATSHLSIIYPPLEQVSTGEDMSIAFLWGSPEDLSVNSTSGAFNSSPFFLPSQGDHDILFSSTDIFLQDLDQSVIPVGESRVDQPLFMQDAQYYSNYYESGRGSSPNIGDYRYGGFLYDDTIKDFSDVSASGFQARTSNIIVKKYGYINDLKTRQQAFDVLIGMMAGDHLFTNSHWAGGSPPDPGMAIDPLQPFSYTFFDDNEWLLPTCKTPILASLRLIAHESSDIRWYDGTSTAAGINPTPIEGVNPYFLDVSDHVMTFSDSWSASGFSEIEHTGTLNFYLNRGMPVNNNVTDALLSLQNKTFYVEIWAGYTRPCPDTGYSSYSRQNGFFKLFTGLCHGGKIDYQYGKNIMSCKVEDYMSVLKGTRFFNSPWFDGVKDINCIHEILQMSGFRDIGKYDPGSLIKSLSDNVNKGSSSVFFHHFDGRLFKMESYALPSAYRRLEQPAFKFNDGDPYSDAISKIAKRAGKVFFFDQFGIAHYENFQDIIESDFLGRVPLSPLCVFTTNPEIWPGQLIFNKLERNYDVQGIFNHIKIMSNTPDFHMLLRDELNWSSMDNPESEGFIGYLKTLYFQEGMFGSKEAVDDAIRKYTVMFRPKIISKFETYGVPLRANDIVQINGENTRVIKVTNNISAEKNQWWMEVETERYQVIQASKSVV